MPALEAAPPLVRPTVAPRSTSWWDKHGQLTLAIVVVALAVFMVVAVGSGAFFLAMRSPAPPGALPLPPHHFGSLATTYGDSELPCLGASPKVLLSRRHAPGHVMHRASPLDFLRTIAFMFIRGLLRPTRVVYVLLRWYPRDLLHIALYLVTVLPILALCHAISLCDAGDA